MHVTGSMPSLAPAKPLLRRPWAWLALLAGPLALGAALAYSAAIQAHFAGDATTQDAWMQQWIVALETVGPWILTGVVGVYWFKAVYTRNLTYVVLMVLTGCLLLRELHWSPTIKTAIYPLLGICFVWMFLWRDIIDKPSANPWHTIFFFSAIATYALSQAVEKRLFRFLPGERAYHSQAEEAVEVAGHLLLLLAAILGTWRRRNLAVRDTA